MDELQNAVQVLQHKDTTKQDAMLALTLFKKLKMKHEEHRVWAASLIEKDNVFQAFSSVLIRFSTDESLSNMTVRAICKLSSVEGSMEALIENELPELLTCVIRKHIMCTSLLLNGLTLIAQLGVNVHIKNLFRIHNGIELIGQVMVVHKSNKDILDKAFFCLANLTVESPENVSTIIEIGAIEQLLQGLEFFSSEPDIVEGAMVTIANVCVQGEQGCYIVHKLNGVQLLHMCSRRFKLPHHSDLVHLCLAAIGSLAINKIIVETIVVDGIVDEVCSKMLGYNGVVRVQAMGVSVLDALLKQCSDERLQDILETHMIPTLLYVARANSYEPALQTPILSIFLGLCRRLSRTDQSLLSHLRLFSSPLVLAALHAIPKHAEVVERATELLARIITDDTVVKRIKNTNIMPTLVEASLQQANQTQTLTKLLDVMSELVSVHMNPSKLSQLEFVRLLAGILAKRKPNTYVFQSTVTLLEHLAKNADAAIIIAPVVGPELLRIVRMPIAGSVVQMVSGVLGFLGTSANAAEQLMEFDMVGALVDTLSANMKNPAVIASLLDALRKLMRGSREAKLKLENLKINRLADHIKFQFSGDARIVRAVGDFHRTLAANDVAAVKKVTHKKKVDASTIKLPELAQDVRLFLVSGGQLTKHCKHAGPRRRHVFVSSDLRFLVWRDPSKTSSKPRSLFLDDCKEVLPGITTKELQRLHKRGKGAQEILAFAVIAEDRTLNLEAETQQLRDQWVQSLTAILSYRRSLTGLRDEDDEHSKPELSFLET